MGFETWWNMYPRKVGKKAAQRSWERLTDGEKAEAIQKLPDHLQYWKNRGTEMEFIPHPTTWLNQGRWEDQLAPSNVLRYRPRQVVS